MIFNDEDIENLDINDFTKEELFETLKFLTQTILSIKPMWETFTGKLDMLGDEFSDTVHEIHERYHPERKLEKEISESYSRTMKDPEVVENVECMLCEGRGVYNNVLQQEGETVYTQETDCPSCQGRGYKHFKPGTNDKGVDDCSECRGKGFIVSGVSGYGKTPFEKCSSCNGTGTKGGKGNED